MSQHTYKSLTVYWPYVVKVAGLCSKKRPKIPSSFPLYSPFCFFFKVLASFLVAGNEEKKTWRKKKVFLSDDLDFFPALTRPKFCAWCSIQATFPTLPNVGTFITDGQLVVWRSFSYRVIVKRSWVWNIRRSVTDIILWFRSHKSVCLLITCVNIQCLASFLWLTEKAGEEAFTVSSAWWASKQDCPSPCLCLKMLRC